jgi:hypothetical protein
MPKRAVLMRSEIETILTAYEADGRRRAKQFLAALAPLNLTVDEIEPVAERITKLDRKALYWVMRRVVKQLREKLEARNGA